MILYQSGLCNDTDVENKGDTTPINGRSLTQLLSLERVSVTRLTQLLTQTESVQFCSV